MQNYVWQILLPLLFLLFSIPVFLRVYHTSKSVIDEEFHLRQGIHFCNKQFNVWDPKITTFPGLYLFTLILSPFNLCTVFCLRLLSLLSATANVIILYKIRRRNLGNAHGFLAALDSFTLSLLPPLYFFSHVYYTDTLSLTTVLLLYYFWLKDAHLQAAIFGAFGVLVRQTNVVWVAMFFGITVMDILVRKYATARDMKQKKVDLFNLMTWIRMMTSLRIIVRSISIILQKCFFYILIILPFVAFVFLNGSIVIGDKNAHEATLHLPQLFYFSVFTCVFGVANFVQKFRSAQHFIKTEKLIVLLLVGIFAIVVKWNTLVHPYLLADNRHYTFYIWNRFFGTYNWFKYTMVPCYVFTIAILYYGIQHMRDSFKIMYWLAVIISLCFQSLLEVRYFLIPFVIFRLNTRPAVKRRSAQYLELAIYIVINFLTFSIFFTKEIIWKEYGEPQRLIW